MVKQKCQFGARSVCAPEIRCLRRAHAVSSGYGNISVRRTHREPGRATAACLCHVDITGSSRSFISPSPPPTNSERSALTPQKEPSSSGGHEEAKLALSEAGGSGSQPRARQEELPTTTSIQSKLKGPCASASRSRRNLDQRRLMPPRLPRDRVKLRSDTGLSEGATGARTPPSGPDSSGVTTPHAFSLNLEHPVGIVNATGGGEQFISTMPMGADMQRGINKLTGIASSGAPEPLRCPSRTCSLRTAAQKDLKPLSVVISTDFTHLIPVTWIQPRGW
ncbi:hypothetical protein EYF80_001221 [Liparis tanakae]|uniref:Uncharacterized protein n=1 Tax=Liparis tanakae TaxID=230148 RepID=A0A4Z2JDY7_9TELE|nr:hypothetical protein EYF80_001221 [Liparis tanakae]